MYLVCCKWKTKSDNKPYKEALLPTPNWNATDVVLVPVLQSSTSLKSK